MPHWVAHVNLGSDGEWFAMPGDSRVSVADLRGRIRPWTLALIDSNVRDSGPVQACARCDGAVVSRETSLPRWSSRMSVSRGA